MAPHSHLPHHPRKRLRPEFLHQEGRDVVGAVGKSPPEGHRLAEPLLLVCTARRPCGAVEQHEGLRLVDHLVARAQPLLHREGVEERFDGGADLPLALAHIVIFEIAVVRAAHIGLDITRLRLHGHESAAEYGFVVADGVVRGHRGVCVALGVPGEHPHFDRLAELGVYLLVALAGLVLQAVTVAPAARLLHQGLHCLAVHVIGERLVLLPLHLPVETLLEILAQMLGDRLLGILLHLGVDGGVDAQSVTVKVVS